MSDHPSQWTVDTLCDYLTQAIDAERRVCMVHFEAMGEAQKVLATETARRLDALNHAREQADALQRTYLPREVYDKATEELAKWRSSVEGGLSIRLPREVYDKTLNDLTAWRSGVDKSLSAAAERRTVFASMIVGGLALLGTIVDIALRLHK